MTSKNWSNPATSAVVNAADDPIPVLATITFPFSSTGTVFILYPSNNDDNITNLLGTEESEVTLAMMKTVTACEVHLTIIKIFD
jgi:hypothetical protein